MENLTIMPEEMSEPKEETYAEMPKTRNGFSPWIRLHKAELFLLGIGITSIIGLTLSVRHRDDIKRLWKSLYDTKKDIDVRKAVDAPFEPILDTLAPKRSYTLPTNPVNVPMHIRTMGGNRHHSPQKEAEAAAKSIHLLPNQTLVDAHRKYVGR